MTAVDRVRRAQRLLGVGAVTAALAWGAATALVILVAGALVSKVSDSLQMSAEGLVIGALLAGLAVAAAVMFRSRRLASMSRVALWIEEALPTLQYALVTAIEPARTEFSDGIDAVVSRADIHGLASRAFGRMVLPAVGAVILAGALLYISPASGFARGAFIGKLAGGGRAASGPLASRIEKITAEVTPPSYAGERTSRLDDPSSITALIGSQIVITGEGSAAGVTADLGSAPTQIRDRQGTWSLSVPMPVKPVALTLHDRQFERIVVLDPRADSPPKVILASPARDTTMRVAKMVVHLSASATDDIGLNSGYFEYLVTTGSGEVFSARTLTTPIVRFNGSRTGSLSSTLDLATLKLNQGDVVSIRAIVQDVNTLSGPGLATSDTRTFRIARADEYDSVAVDAAAPPPVDSSAMSQRMLIMMTEQLVKDQKKIQHTELVKRSGIIGDMENRVKNRVHEILYELDGGAAEEAPDPAAGLTAEEPSEDVHAVQNPDLFQAYQALWDAVRSLEIAEPSVALPPMRVALKALDRARLANRLYLRGTPPKVIIDIARVRMAGKEKGSGSSRTPRTRADSVRADLSQRFESAIEALPKSPESAIRDLTLLRVEALSGSPSFAAALSDAIDAFHKGKDATLPLLRARRALDGDPQSKPGLPSWSGTW
jgi:hypothetical protein